MKNQIKIISFLIIAFLLMAMCGCSNNKYVNDARKDVDIADGDDVTNSNGKALNPFEGLIVKFDGVSPYCTISFNNAKCSEEVQQYVEYSVDPNEIITTEKHFKINEVVTVYASLKNQSYDDPEFILASESKKYEVKNVPEYITEITDDIDLSNLKSEIQDYLVSITAFSNNSEITDWGFYPLFNKGGYKASKNLQKEQTFYSNLKLNAYDKFKNGINYFNKIDFLYSIEMMSHRDEDFQKRYFTIVAKNIVKYPDGTIGWGLEDPADRSFEYFVDATSMESLLNSHTVSIKADYNVTELTDNLK